MDSFTTLDLVFLGFACVGGILFIIRLVMMFVGLDADHGDVDVTAPDDLHVGDGDVGHAGTESDISFTLLSFQGLTAFFMMFGLVGLAMSRGSGFGAMPSLMVGAAAGLSTVWIIGKLFKFFSSLQESGTMNLNSAIGTEGIVYLTIPEDQPGKVRLVVHGSLRVMDAVSESKTRIPTDSRVRVTGLVNENVLVVEKV